jgi:hypothetical protein
MPEAYGYEAAASGGKRKNVVQKAIADVQTALDGQLQKKLSAGLKRLISYKLFQRMLTSLQEVLIVTVQVLEMIRYRSSIIKFKYVIGDIIN